MKSFNTYIIEKLKINKDTKFELDFPVSVEMWFPEPDIYNMRDWLHDYSNIIRFGITNKKETDKILGSLYSVEVENKKDLLSLFIFCYHYYVCYCDDAWSDIQKKKFSGMDKVKDQIKNYDDLKNYINSFTKEEYQKALDEQDKIYQTKC